MAYIYVYIWNNATMMMMMAMNDLVRIWTFPLFNIHQMKLGTSGEIENIDIYKGYAINYKIYLFINGYIWSLFRLFHAMIYDSLQSFFSLAIVKLNRKHREKNGQLHWMTSTLIIFSVYFSLCSLCASPLSIFNLVNIQYT